MSARLFVICGLPGAGKTTLARQLEAAHGAVRYCPDEWMLALGSDIWDQDLRVRLHEVMWAQAQRLLSLGVNVVIEFGSWSRAERDEIRTGARRIGAGVELHYVDAPIGELLRRIEARGNNEGITRSHLEEWQHVIEVPDRTERDLFDTPLP